MEPVEQISEISRSLVELISEISWGLERVSEISWSLERISEISWSLWSLDVKCVSK